MCECRIDRAIAENGFYPNTTQRACHLHKISFFFVFDSHNDRFLITKKTLFSMCSTCPYLCADRSVFTAAFCNNWLLKVPYASFFTPHNLQVWPPTKYRRALGVAMESPGESCLRGKTLSIDVKVHFWQHHTRPSRARIWESLSL